MVRLLLKADILGMRFNEQGEQLAVPLPTGAVITCPDRVAETPPTNPTETVTVIWEGMSLAVFLVDLQERGIKQPNGPPTSRGRSA
jgi:hypothetical protein